MINKKHLYLSLFVFIVLGVALRIYNVGFQCFWYEETYTRTIAQMTFSQIWTVIISTDFTPPLFYYIEHIFGLLFGYGNDALRAPSVIFGVATIPAMYWLGKEYKDEIAGLFCAGVLATLYPMIYFSQFARTYALTIFFFVIVLIYYIKMNNGNTDKKTILLFGLMSGLCTWSHLYSAIPIGIMIADSIWTLKSPKLSVYLAMLYTVIIMPLIQMPYTLLNLRLKTRVTTDPNELQFGLKWYEMIATTPTEFFSTIFPFIGILTVSGLFIEQINGRGKIAFKLIAIAIITIISGIVLSPFTPMYPRYYLTVATIFILIASVPVSYLSEHIKTGWKTIAVLLGTIIFFAFFQNAELITHFVTQKYVC